MKKLRLIFILAVLILPSCDHKPPSIPDCLTASSDFRPDDCPGNGTCTFEYYPDSKLQINGDGDNVSYEIKAGSNLVFHFEYRKHETPMVTDDGYTESITFEAKPDGNTFIISRQDLKNAGAIFGRMCFCPDGGYMLIDQGCIYGYKINNRIWNISLNLTASSRWSNYNRMKQRDFSRTVRPN